MGESDRFVPREVKILIMQMDEVPGAAHLSYHGPAPSDGGSQPASVPYPVNMLRNLALCHVKTTHFVYVDMDFWPSSTLYTRLQLAVRLFPDKLLDETHATVVPAFQLEFVRALRACEHVPRSN